MAIEIRPFTVTIPAGTAISAGFTQALSMPARVVSQIDVRVPPGPRGEVGFGIGNSGVIVIPYGGGSYIVTDDESLTYALETPFNSGAWQFFGYNTGAYDHTIRIYFHCELLSGTSAATGSVPIDSGSLSSTGGDTGTGGSVPPVTTPPPDTTPPPVVTPPPVTPPGNTGAPLTLPPAVPLPPGTAGPTAAPTPDQLLVAVPDAGTVWLLGEGSYTPCATQDDVNALSGAGVPGANVSAAMHQALYAASSALLTIDLGGEVLTGLLKVT